MAERAAELLGSSLSLVLGGFHLEGAPKDRLEALASRLRPLAKTLAPGHCTGKEAIEFLSASFQNVVPLAVGKTFSWEEEA
jgi:7,8-dihydropterin-6-yl-methyl-4-(beta-D-ribofuranosyl)aminobenzene 5'-phosphate synthase